MLGVIILHEAMPSFVLCFFESWKECMLQYLGIHLGVHNAIEDTDVSRSMPSNPSPNMRLNPLAAEFFFNLLALKEYFHSWNHV